MTPPDEVAAAPRISRLVRLRARARRLWQRRLDRMLAWQHEHGLVAALSSTEWQGLCHATRRAEGRMTRLRAALRAAGWRPSPPRPAAGGPKRR